MLKYSIHRRDIGNDTDEILYDNVTLTNYMSTYGENMCVTITSSQPLSMKRNEIIHAIKTHVVGNHSYGTMLEETEICEYPVHAVDYGSNIFTLIAPKYKILDTTYIMMDVDDQNGPTIVFGFEQRHLFDSLESNVDGQNPVVNHGNVLYLFYDGNRYARLCNVTEIDDYTAEWVVDQTIENFTELCAVLFPEWDVNEQPSVMYGESTLVTAKRLQTMWCDSNDPSDYNPVITVEHPMLSIDVPISLTNDVRLNREDNVRDNFVNEGIRNSINRTPEMEKHVYKPSFITGVSDDADYSFDLVRKINFNLHFRNHSGDDWLTENGDSWNFATYGNGSTANAYYSYNEKSNQSDLLCYLGFRDTDVKYQKNKLKKSFLRLSFYDTDRPGNQTLLAHETIFMNVGALYSKYMNSYTDNIYRNIDGVVLTGARIDREVDENLLRQHLRLQIVPNDETIEKYRLSSQLSVSDPAISDFCGEGFNLYLWADNDNGIIPSDIYMKAEFNHAGYGRVIPMMAPYWNEPGHQAAFKTNNEIIGDWSTATTQYGPARYKKYSYIKLKYRYDKNVGKHIYYLDPERYGTGFGDVLNINLYEARVAFND